MRFVTSPILVARSLSLEIVEGAKGRDLYSNRYLLCRILTSYTVYSRLSNAYKTWLKSAKHKGSHLVSIPGYDSPSKKETPALAQLTMRIFGRCQLVGSRGM